MCVCICVCICACVFMCVFVRVFRAAELMTRTGAVVTLEVAKQGAIYHGLATLLNQPSPMMQRGELGVKGQEGFLRMLESGMILLNQTKKLLLFSFWKKLKGVWSQVAVLSIKVVDKGRSLSRPVKSSRTRFRWDRNVSYMWTKGLRSCRWG